MKRLGRPRRARGVPSHGRLLFALFLSALLIPALLGASAQPVLEGVPLEEDPEGEWTPLAFGAAGDGLVLVCGGERGLLLRLTEEGQVTARAVLDQPLRWAALRSGRLFLREDRADGAALLIWDPESLREVGRVELGVPARDLLLLDCAGGDALAFVQASDRQTLRLVSGDGEDALTLPGEISFLAADGGTWLAACGQSLWVIGPQGREEIACLAPVVGSPGGGLALDEDGVVSRIEGSALTPLLRLPAPLYSPLSFCLDGENCLIVSSGGRAVSRYDLAGEPLAARQLPAAPEALCPAGAVFSQNGTLRYAAFHWAGDEAEEESPSPSPSASPSPDPQEDQAAEIRAEGDYLLAPAGTTAATLRELLWPDVADLRDALGRQVVQGRLATGMTVNDWTVVVLGDCDGTGTVTQKDVRAVLLLLLEDREAQGAFRRAADVNADGVVDSRDLLLLCGLVEK